MPTADERRAGVLIDVLNAPVEHREVRSNGQSSCRACSTPWPCSTRVKNATELAALGWIDPTEIAAVANEGYHRPRKGTSPPLQE